MKPLVNHTGVAALMNRQNVDTDQIIPKQFLKKISKSGFGQHLFHDWRFLDDEGTKPNPDFELNNPKFTGASILVTGDNFGCGSSREHAPWAIEDYGFRVIVSTSYADIFFNNCFKNGILPIRVTQEELDALIEEIANNEGVQFSVDLPEQKLTTPGGITINFDVDSFRKDSLINGLDDIGWTLEHKEKIDQFEAKQKQHKPWLWK